MRAAARLVKSSVASALAVALTLGCATSLAEDYSSALSRGKNLWGKGDYTGADQAFRAANTDSEKHEPPPEISLQIGTWLMMSQNVLGNFEIVKGKIFPVISSYPVFGKESEQKAIALRELAKAEEGLGEYESAQRDYQRMIETATQALGANTQTIAPGLVGLARVDFLRGNFQKAENELSQADKLGVLDPIERARILIAKGQMNVLRSRLAEAEGSFKEAEALLAPMERVQNPDLAEARIGLAEISLAKDQPQGALSILKAATRLCSQLSTGSTFLTLQDTIGLAELASGDKPASFKSLSETLTQRKDLHHGDQWLSLGHLGAYYAAVPDFAKSESNLLEASGGIRASLGGGSPILATFLVDLAAVYRQRDRFDEARKALDEAKKTQADFLAADSPAAADRDFEEGLLAQAVGDQAGSEAILRRVLKNQAQLLPPKSGKYIETERSLGLVLLTLHRDSEAEPLLRDWMAGSSGTVPPDSLANLDAGIGLATIQLNKGAFSEAERSFSGLLKPAKDSPRLPLVNAGLASSLYRQQKFSEAIPYFEASVKSSSSIGAALDWEHLGDCYYETGKPLEASSAYAAALEHVKGASGASGSADQVRLRFNLGRSYLGASQLKQADEYGRLWISARPAGPFSENESKFLARLAKDLFNAADYQSAEFYLVPLVADSERSNSLVPDSYEVVLELAKTYQLEGKKQEAAGQFERFGIRYSGARPEQAEMALKEALQFLKGSVNAGSPASLPLLQALAALQIRRHQLADAKETLEQAQSIINANNTDGAGPTALLTRAIHFQLRGELAQANQDAHEAESQYRQVEQILMKLPDPPQKFLVGFLFDQGSLAMSTNRLAEADSYFERFLKLAGSMPPDDIPVEQINLIADLYPGTIRYSEAEQLFQKVLKISERAYGDHSLQAGQAMYNLAGIYRVQDRYEPAEKLGLQAVSVFEALQNADWRRKALQLLAGIYHSAGNNQKAVEFREVLLHDSGFPPKQRPEQLSQLGEEYTRIKAYAKALRTYQELVNLFPSSSPDDPDLLKAKENLVVAYIDAGKAEQSRPLYWELQKYLHARSPKDEEELNRACKEAYSRQERPDEMTKMIVTLESPAAPHGSYAAQPWIYYRAGNKYCRMEYPPNPAEHVQLLKIANEPNYWTVDLVKKKTVHFVDPSPEQECRMPIFHDKPVKSETDTNPFLELEYGQELEYFEGKGAEPKQGPVLREKQTMAYTVQISDWQVILYTVGTPERPWALARQRGKTRETYWYDLYEQLPFNPQLFVNPEGL